jgi:hypothetical protein
MDFHPNRCSGRFQVLGLGFGFGCCNVPPPRGRARLHLAVFLGHRLPSQTNTSLFYTLCPHSGRTFRSVTHHSRPRRLTLEFFGDGLPKKKLQLVGMSIKLILLSPGPGCYRCPDTPPDPNPPRCHLYILGRGEGSIVIIICSDLPCLT